MLVVEHHSGDIPGSEGGERLQGDGAGLSSVMFEHVVELRGSGEPGLLNVISSRLIPLQS